MKKAARETAAATYQIRRREIEAMIGLLQSQLDDHAREAARDPRNWGFPGDLDQISQNLRETLVFLTGDSDEEAAGEKIEKAVAARMA